MANKRTLLALLVAFTCTCAPATTLSKEELGSHLRAVISLVQDTDVLINQIVEGRLSTQFLSGHAAYLYDEAVREGKISTTRI